MAFTNLEDSELVLGIISPVGTDTEGAIRHLIDHLCKFNYQTKIINVSGDILKKFEPNFTSENEYERISHYMDLGNKIRENVGDNSILMKGVASNIFLERDANEPMPKKRMAYIIKSIKHPDEVSYLRSVYGVGFHLLGMTSNYEERRHYLTASKNIDARKADELLDRDANENMKYGQHTQDAFQKADYFIVVGDSEKRLQNSIYRLVDLLFGDPFITPNFDEYAMFMAYAASLRSADLSRQIGAVVARDNEVLSSGANDCPKFGGGLYWTEINENGEYCDELNGRDYMNNYSKTCTGYDSNKIEQRKIIDGILDNLQKEHTQENIDAIKQAGVSDLTEYGRVVHGEMEALLMCSRNNISCKDATLYATTFPCHNCAKHIIAAGIREVVYIEPYPKSKAFEFYTNEISENSKDKNKVLFKPFVGVGPQRFTDLFSVNSIMWEKRIRKNGDGFKVSWDRKHANLRTPMRISNYIELESLAVKNFKEEVDAANKKEVEQDG